MICKKNLTIVTILIFIIIILSGCWDTHEINETQFPFYITIDTSDDLEKPYHVAMQIPIFNPKSPKNTNNISTNSFSLESAINNMQIRTLTYVSLGMLRSMIFSEEIARKGILPHIDTIWRNPMIPGTIIFAITPGHADELKKIKLSYTNNLGKYIESLFDSNSKNALLPEITLNDFFIDLKNRGVDPYIPIIEYGTNDIKIIGAGLFKEDKMVGKIDNPECRALLILKNQLVKGDISLKINNHMVSYYIQKANTKIKQIYKKGNFKFEISVDILADMKENTSAEMVIENPSKIKNMERHLAAAFEKEMNRLVVKLKRNKSDAIGTGKIAKTEYPEIFEYSEWDDCFQQAIFDIKVNVVVRRLGIST
jgi:Ger(x)C family germination protein